MSDKLPALVLPPGEFIKEELEARDWTQVELAQILGRPTQAINEILLGKRGITLDMAQSLGEAFGTSAELWMNLETAYRLSLSPPNDKQISRRARLYGKVPVHDMVKRGWIAPAADIEEQEAAVLRFLELTSLDDTPRLIAAARKSTSYTEMSPAQLAWLYRAKQMADASDVTGKYSKNALRERLGDIRNLATDPQETRKLPRVLSELGIRLVVVEPLPRTKIDGAAFWLDYDRPVIALSLRYDRLDSFWHTATHELAHIYSDDARDGTPVIDIGLVGSDRTPASERPESERKIDAMAANFLVPQDKLNSFCDRYRPLFSKVRITQFANLHNVHPGIVVGQLQYRGEIGYQHSREMLVKVRDAITSAAFTDGFGYIAETE